MRIAIAGAGVAGLASATFLARSGHDVTIYDQFPEPRPVGSGLMIQPVGLAVLDRLGLADEVRALARPITRIYGETARGRAILDVAYADLRENAQGYAIQRAALFDLLFEAAHKAGARLIPTTVIRTADATTKTAHLITEAGATAPADLVLDCLGAYSPLCPAPTVPLSYGALWALLDWPEDAGFAPDRLEQRYRAASYMAGVLPVGRISGDASEKLTFFWSLRGSDHAAWRTQPIADWKAEVTKRWPAMAALLDQIDGHDDLIFAQYTHRTVRSPGRGRIAHLGDSYHATSPQLGQGANMALLDAAALSQALARYPDPVEATAHFAYLRRFHVRLYQSASWLFTPLYQSDGRTLPWVRDWLAAPVARIWPMPGILAGLVAGEIGRPLVGIQRSSAHEMPD